MGGMSVILCQLNQRTTNELHRQRRRRKWLNEELIKRSHLMVGISNNEHRPFDKKHNEVEMVGIDTLPCHLFL